MEEPALLSPLDLETIRAECDDGAATYAFVLGSFHFINRIADLLHVSPEAIPEVLRPMEPVRKMGVRIAAKLIGKSMDLENRPYASNFKSQVDYWKEFSPSVSCETLGILRPTPWVIEGMALASRERTSTSSLPLDTQRRIHEVVEESLPQSRADIEGFHPRPEDAVEAFAFVGTRYAQRTTPEIIDALRMSGYDDRGILDLAVAVADANHWARFHRLLGLAPNLYYQS